MRRCVYTYILMSVWDVLRGDSIAGVLIGSPETPKKSYPPMCVVDGRTTFRGVIGSLVLHTSRFTKG